MENNSIKIKGAKVHNLKNIDVNIPRDKFTVITGISGSGKSSLAFDVLYAEGQRRYIESLSPYARQFLGIADKPNVEKIEGISPAISISPKKAIRNPRSTVGTVAEVYDYLRLLFSKIGKPHCPICSKLLSKQTVEQIAASIIKISKGKEIIVLAPLVRMKKGEHKGILEEMKRKGFVRVRIDGIFYKFEEALGKDLEPNKAHNIELAIDQMILGEDFKKDRLVDSLKIALRLGRGLVIISFKSQDFIFNENYACEDCGISLPEIEPRFFSFNNPLGACPECTGLGEKMEIDPDLLIPNKNLTIDEGAIRPYVRTFHRYGEHNYFWNDLMQLAQRHNFSLGEPVKDLGPEKLKCVLYGDSKFEGVIPNLEKKYKSTQSNWTHHEIEQYMKIKICPKCGGKRLRPEVLAVKTFSKSIVEMADMSVSGLHDFFIKSFKEKKSSYDMEIARPIIKEIINQLNLLQNVGLDYLTLSRKASTLAGGEEQRIRLAIQIAAKLHGVLYVLDEPSIGLHARDQGKIIKIIKELRDLGNTVVVVEHDPQTIKSADWIIDIGPKAGEEGGKVIFEGKPEKLLKTKTLTGEYLSGKKKIECRSFLDKSEARQKLLIIKGARENNLKDINVKIPLEKFICVTGVSGSGKSSLVDDILAKYLMKKFYRAKDEPGEFKEIIGAEFLNKVVLVDQSPIGRTPRSNPATYTGAFFFIRELFAKTKEARIRGYSSGRFSFNVKGGRCEACEGQGQVKVEMYFLPDVYVQCKECKGKRYNSEALEIEYKGKNISEVLDMSVFQSLEFFKDVPGLYSKLKTLDQVGLSYLKLGQPATSLSGGEAQRVKLAAELSRKSTGNTLYILDEPTSGLHFYDIGKLVSVLRDLVLNGNTVLAVEHNIDFIKCADWIVDLGPEGGDKGGYVIAEGGPKEISKNKKSITGKYLK
jgi:excinuclease ABC subunit A